MERGAAALEAVDLSQPLEVSAAAGADEPLLPPLISFIVPCYNASATLDEALASVLAQDYDGPLEIAAADDGSSDATLSLLERWRAKLAGGRISMVVAPPLGGPARPHGPAMARNRCCAAARGAYFCLLDSDDVALPCRARLQLAAARRAEARGERLCLIGGRFERLPDDATPTYSAWANGLSSEDLVGQQWRECTLVQPTWFMRRDVFESLGGYDEVQPALQPALLENNSTDGASTAAAAAAATAAAEGGAGFGAGVAPWPACERAQRHPPLLSRPPLTVRACFAAERGGAGSGEGVVAGTGTGAALHTVQWFGEDPILFHRHLARGGTLALADPQVAVIRYRFSGGSLSWRTPRPLLLRIRAAMFEERMLAPRRAAYAEGTSPVPASATGPTRTHADSAVASSPECLSASSGELPPRWRRFTVWGAGRDGKAFFHALSPAGRRQVAAFCDVDPRKIGQRYPQPTRARAGAGARGRGGGRRGSGADAGADGGTGVGEAEAEGVPIVHLSRAALPIVCCVSLETAGAALRENARRFFPGTREGEDLLFFV